MSHRSNPCILDPLDTGLRRYDEIAVPTNLGQAPSHGADHSHSNVPAKIKSVTVFMPPDHKRQRLTAARVAFQWPSAYQGN